MPDQPRFSRGGPEAVTPAIVSRQPILDRSDRVVGFELVAPAADPRAATSSVLVQSIVDIGLTRLVGARPAHVDVTREFLLAVRPLPLVPEQVVLELQMDGPADDALLMALREARDAGFRIALDGFDGGEEALLELADMVKLDAGRADADAVARLRASNVTLVADRVQTRDVHRACLELGFDAFQGAYFAEPEVVTGHPVPTYRLRALSMLAQGESTTFEQLERVIVEDPGLSLKLVKLANSAFFGGRQRVGSIRQALMALGSVAVRRWATLLVLAGVSDRPSHLLEHGLVRARLCELIATRGSDADPERAFTVGLLSVADALLGIKMPVLLMDLPFDERTQRALGEHEGPEGRLLGGVLAYERGDFDGCAVHGVSLVDVALAYRDAIDWTDGALVALTA